MAAAGLGLTGAGAVLAYGALLVLGFSVFVAGHYFKIVPFLVWYHRFGLLVGRESVPMVVDLCDARLARGAGVLLMVGAVAVVAGILVASAAVVAGGGVAWTAGALLETGQMIRIARSRPAADAAAIQR